MSEKMNLPSALAYLVASKDPEKILQVHEANCGCEFIRRTREGAFQGCGNFKEHWRELEGWWEYLCFLNVFFTIYKKPSPLPSHIEEKISLMKSVCNDGKDEIRALIGEVLKEAKCG